MWMVPFMPFPLLEIEPIPFNEPMNRSLNQSRRWDQALSGFPGHEGWVSRQGQVPTVLELTFVGTRTQRLNKIMQGLRRWSVAETPHNGSPIAGDPGLTPGRESRSYMPQLTSLNAAWQNEDPSAAAKTQHGQINRGFSWGSDLNWGTRTKIQP